MASKSTYPCFACRKAGQEVMVFLDGKDEQGRTKYLNEDGTKHTHLGSGSSGQHQQTEQQQQQQLASQKPIWDIVNAKLDRIIALLSTKEEERA